MKRIALISDTHGYLCERSKELIGGCDEVWHAGDIGSVEVLDTLSQLKPLRAVHGNIDGGVVKLSAPALLRFEAEGLDVLMTHIAGVPGKYEPSISRVLRTNPPKLLVCGHSHILKVMNDKHYKLLYMNPGALGKQGFHTHRTMLIFEVDNGKCANLRVVEWER